jgi:hypothetical protein
LESEIHPNAADLALVELIVTTWAPLITRYKFDFEGQILEQL